MSETRCFVRHAERDEEVLVERLESTSDGVSLHRVTIGERVYEIERQEAGSAMSVRLGDAQYEAAIASTAPSQYAVTLGSETSEVEVLDPLSHLAAAAGGGAAGRGANEVRAYMPGRVVSILVAQGEPVAVGQGVFGARSDEDGERDQGRDRGRGPDSARRVGSSGRDR